MLRDWLKRHFIPHRENDYKPHILQETAVVGMMCLVIISFSFSNLQSFLWTASEWMVSTILPAVIVSDTNKERDQADLAPLVRNEVLDQAAQLKADDMARESYFSHYSPSGLSPWYWFSEVGYDYVHAGENLAVHFTDSSEVVNAWMNSPSHRANILDGNFREIGIGVAKGTYEGYKTVFVVQLFGTVAAQTESSPSSIVSASTETSLSTETEITRTDDDSVAPIVAGAETVSVASTETVEVTNDGTVVFSSYVSTTTGAEPAALTSGGEVTTPPVLAVATQPHRVIQALYILIGLFVSVSLTLSILIEARRQQPVQVAYGAGLLVLMLLLFQIHISITSGVLIA